MLRRRGQKSNTCIKISPEDIQLCVSVGACIGTVVSWPEPLFEHLGKRSGQPWSTGEGNSAV